MRKSHTYDPMPDPSPPAREGGCGFALAVIALLLSLGAVNQARSQARRSMQKARQAERQVEQLESQVQRLERRLEALEER